METILGIDLGTTNSEVSVIRDKEIIVVEKDGRKLLPSVVGIDPSGNLLVGYTAKNQAILYPDRTIKSIKRRMGEDIFVKLGDREYSPPEISAMILRTLRSYAEEYLSQQITKAVITVPAFFNDTQRAATRLAGELAGLEVVRIINEPTAASLVYGSDPGKKETLLVYDLGGGTFDVSILRIEDSVMEVLASHGDTHLGGDDFDQLLFDYVCTEFKKKNKIDLRDNPIAVNRTMQVVEEAKKQLSIEPFTVIKEEFLVEKDGMPIHLDMEISRNRYEEMILPLIEKTIVCINDALHDAQLHPSDIDRIILVGGASRTPLVHQLIENRMGTTPHGEIDPDLCVTMGAAVQGGLITGVDVGRVLIDITPHTLGINVLDRYNDFPYAFAPLIKRNTPVPCSRSEVFSTVYDYQTLVEIRVFQGESDDVRQNVEIGNFRLSGLSSVQEGNEIICRFDLDINGILHVSAMEKSTGLQNEIMVENAMENHKTDENTAFRKHLNDFFVDTEYVLPEAEDDSETTEETSEMEISDSYYLKGEFVAKIEKDWAKNFSSQIALLQRAAQIAAKVSADDLSEVKKNVLQVIDALKQNKQEKTEATASELEDLLYYLEDSV